MTPEYGLSLTHLFYYDIGIWFVVRAKTDRKVRSKEVGDVVVHDAVHRRESHQAAHAGLGVQWSGDKL